MKTSHFLYPILTFTLILFSCKKTAFEEPSISLEDYVIHEGFQLQIAASEPFLEAPVTMDFDNQGRMWVVEMKGFMQNLEGTSQDLPNGTISIMEDLDGDGITDHSKIFLDELILPRAIAHVYGGVLYAEPPNLWFVNIENDKPVNKILVDSLYSDGGNVEHQPNGLMMNIDNWIYNAKSNFRYQRKDGKWIKEPTTFRGQWGISKDNFGRLYYNNNSTQIIGDYVLPNTIIKNQYNNPTSSVNKTLTKNQRVYPLHPTSVNRGYRKGVLDKDSLLINVTSSCGPLIYRGDKYEKDYAQNAFVCAPEANIVKRNILTFHGNKITAKQAWADKEFIASTDEGFRPVNLFNGPDGNMYIVDMHRGIIQDKAYLSLYLKNQMAYKQLDTIVGMGRILRVTANNSTSVKIPDLNKASTEDLIDLLNHSNGWLRDRAQQILVNKNDSSIIPSLVVMALNDKNAISQIHALHTINGLNGLSFDVLERVINSSSNSMTISHALVLLEQFSLQEKCQTMSILSKNLLLKKDPEIDLYLALSLGEWAALSNELFFPILYHLSDTYSDHSMYQDAITNSLRAMENSYLAFSTQQNNQHLDEALSDDLKKVVKNKNSDKKNSIFVQTKVETDGRTAGYNTFRTLCAACHGMDGNGIEGLAPPLKGSEYVMESVNRLALIILHGMEGPIHINGKRYDYNNTMPGLINNPDFSDEDIANIIKYLHRSFPNNSESISPDEIKPLRDYKPENGNYFTEEELNNLTY